MLLNIFGFCPQCFMERLYLRDLLDDFDQLMCNSSIRFKDTTSHSSIKSTLWGAM